MDFSKVSGSANGGGSIIPISLPQVRSKEHFKPLTVLENAVGFCHSITLFKKQSVVDPGGRGDQGSGHQPPPPPSDLWVFW